VRESIATIEANSWLPDSVIGDVMANIAACVLGVRRWHEQISSRWSAPKIRSLIDAQFEASAALARHKVTEIPDGEYHATCEMDDSGLIDSPPLQFAVRIEVEDSRMLVDLSDMPPQVEGPINSGRYDGAISSIRVGFKSLIAPERGADEGLFEPLEVVIPDGTVFSSVNNGPMAMWQQLPPTLIDLFLKAIGERLPERVTAGHFGTMAAANIAGRGADGRWWYTVNSGGGGFGASAHADGSGPFPTLMVGDNPMVPIELREGRYPVRFSSYRVLRNSGGRGLHRGGPGYEETFEILEDALLSTVMNRTRDPAWGLAGGEPGKPGEIHIKLPGSNRWRKVTWLSSQPVPAGTLVRKRTGGGGGWGPVPAKAQSASAENSGT
jgi:N-methylhydantoinase B